MAGPEQPADRHDSERRGLDDALFRVAFVESSVPSCLTAPSGHLLVANRALCALLGYAAEELCERGFAEITHPDDLPASRECVRSLLAGEQRQYRLRKRYLHRDGAAIWCQVSTVLVRDAGGGPAYFVTDIVDLRPQLAADEQVRSARDRAQQYLDVAAVILVGLDRAGRVALLNRAGQVALGWREEELRGRDWFDTCLPPEVRVSTRAVFTRLLAGAESPPGEYTNPVLTRSGEERLVRWRNVVIRDAQGAPIGTLSSGEDLTELQRAQLGHLESEARHRELVDNLDDLVFLLDLDGRFVYANPVFERAYGYPVSEVLGRPFADFVHTQDLPALWASFQRTLAGSTETQEFRGVDRQGRLHALRARSRAWFEKGRVVGVTGVAVDLTEQREAEERARVAQRMEAVGRLAGGVAHDFNNLVTVIDSYAGFALAALGEAHPVGADLREIRAAAARAASLTRQLLAFSRRQLLAPEVLSLNRVVEGLRPMLDRLLGEDIALEVRLADPLGAVRADQGQLEQVLMNLAVNARDAMPEGGRLTIETADVELDAAYAARHQAVHPGPHVLLAVSDDGCGMDGATLAHAFEPFFTTKEQGRGTGLGLATVYGIVKQSGGSIWLYSEPGQGTTVKVYLPRVDGEPVERRPPGELRLTGGDETILVVEDEAAVRKIAARLLGEAGYRVLTAEGPEVALALGAGGETIDLLLTDVVMPQMSGRRLADELQAQRPDLAVLYMSGYTDNAIVHHGVLEPGTAFIGKPFSRETLLTKVRELLDCRAAARP